MTPSTELIRWIEDRQLPWLMYDPSTGRVYFVIDNYLLSQYRGCPSYFFELAVEGYHQKSLTTGAPERSWPLDFGILFHKMMEVYYRSFRELDFSLEDFAIKTAWKYWNEMNMNIHLTHRESQQMGAAPGFGAMLIQYALQFKSENERLRIIAHEVSFGKAKEVPIYVGKSGIDHSDLGFDIYLSGRIDILGDDGFRILPLDHKTMGSFRGDPLARFLVDDGPVGYIYAMKKVLPTIVPEELILKRDCNQILMNLISKAIPKEGSRFKRFALQKSDAALEAYRHRVITTCSKIMLDLENYIRGIMPDRDSKSCNNWFFHQCPYFDVHRQQDRAGELATLSNGYIKLPIWDTQAIQPIED